MIKKFYVFAWLLLIGSAAGSVLNGSISELGMVAYGLIGLALVYALAVWAVLAAPVAVDSPGLEPMVYRSTGTRREVQ